MEKYQLRKTKQNFKSLITVIIPTIGRSSISRSIESILNQYCSDKLSLLIVDNSKDSGEFIKNLIQEKKVSKKVHSLKHILPPKSSQLPAGENFQRGINKVDTKYFCILGDDDILSPGWLDIVLQNIKFDINIFGYCGNVHHVKEDGSFIRSTWLAKKDLIYKPLKMFKKISTGQHPEIHGFVFKKDTFKNFKFSRGMELLDIEMILKASQEGPIKFINYHSATMFSHQGSGSSMKVLNPDLFIPSMFIIEKILKEKDYKLGYRYSFYTYLIQGIVYYKQLIYSGSKCKKAKLNLKKSVTHLRSYYSFDLKFKIINFSMNNFSFKANLFILKLVVFISTGQIMRRFLK